MHIDHLVWYSADLAEGMRQVSRHMACEPRYGGEHPGEGTANAVMALGPTTYLEILGRDVNQPEAKLDAEVGRLTGTGLYHWAVGGIDLEVLAARAARAGLAGGGLVPGGRLKPDGTRLDWVCWGLRDHPFGALVPFFIDWRGSEHPAASAPPGGRLSAFELQTPAADELKDLFAALGLDIPVVAHVEPRILATLEGGRGRMELSSFAPVPQGYVI